MKKPVLLIATVGLVLGYLASRSIAWQQPRSTPASELSLRIEEAQTMVKLYEIRLHNAEVIAEQEGLKWENVNATFAQIEKSREVGAVPEKTYREAKENYDWYRLQDKIQDWQEIAAELEIAKIRLRMVERGIVVYGGEKP